MALSRLQALAACCTITLGLTGCSGLRLYNSERDHQGEAARKAWSEVDLKATIDAERANLKKLLAAELNTQEKLAASIRDHQLRWMVGSDSVTTGLVEPIDAKLISLIGRLDLPTEARNKVLASQKIVFQTKKIFSMNGVAAPDCASIADGTPKNIQAWLDAQTEVLRKASIRSSLDVLRRECASNFAEDEVYAPLGGAIGVAYAEYVRDKEILDKRMGAVKPLQKAYADAREKYDQAVAEATVDPRSSANVRDAAGKLHDAIAALSRSGNPYADKLLAEERLKSIDAFAQAITAAEPGKPIPKDASETAAVFIVIPEFLDDARTALAQAKKPLALPLLIRRNYEQLNLEAAKRDIAATEAIVNLSHDLVVATYLEAEQLGIARGFLTPANVVAVHKKPFYEAFKNSGMSEREALYGAAARYLDAVNRLDAQRYKIEYMRIAAYHERALAYAEINAKQWESVIGITVNQVADYSASGFKPEQIANFLNTLGLFYIGAGVH